MLGRYRTSAHTLRIELGRYSRPATPLSERKCCFCESGEIDDEKHFILFCDTFQLKRRCFLGRLLALFPNYPLMSDEEKLRFILCPPTTEIAKCVSKFLGIMTRIRKEIDLGLNPLDLQIYIKHEAVTK